MAQITPFLFYAIGGYFALTGRLEIGQLVAVIAAYRDLPPPVKELIDWDQQRLDAEAKFQQVTEQFALRHSARFRLDVAAGPSSTSFRKRARSFAQGLTASARRDIACSTGSPSLAAEATHLLSGTGEGAGCLARCSAAGITPAMGRSRSAMPR